MTIEVGNRTGSYKIWGVTFFTRHELSSSTNYHFDCVRKCQDCLGFLAVRQILNQPFNHSQNSAKKNEESHIFLQKNVGFLSSVQVKPIFPLLSHHSCWLSWHVGWRNPMSQVKSSKKYGFPAFSVGMFLRWPFFPGQHQLTSQDDEVDMAEVAEEVRFICGCILADAMFMSIGILPIL